jgi:2-methylcitrate dehydratase PrpD
MEAMLRNVKVRMDAVIPANFEEMWVEVTARTRDERELRERCDRPRGICGNPLTREARLEKFRSTAGVLPAGDDVEEARALIEALVTLPSLRDLIAALQRGR